MNAEDFDKLLGAMKEKINKELSEFFGGLK
jgi:hypothetical protein